VTALALRMLRDDMLEKQRHMLRQLAVNKQLLLAALDARPFIEAIIPGQANFVLLRTKRAAELRDFCAERGVIVRGFPSDPLLQGYLRISVGSAQDIDALATVLDQWEKQP
jgi:histidinol-phosphate/aromatic aminotransferase/cobyric acid decarboxylase-like protein